MASELHPWRFELEIFPSRLPCGHVFEPKLNAQQGAICEAFFFKNASSRAQRGVLVSTSLWLGPIDSLPFATVVFWLCLKTKTKFKEKHGKKTPLSTFHCNQLQHIRSACFKTDLPDHFRFNFVHFEMQTTQMLEASCLFSFKSILLRTSGKCQSIKRTACMLNYLYSTK